MPFYRSIRARRKRKKVNSAFELQLTSMMDVLVIIVVFLLKTYATSQNNFATVPGLKMPISASQDNPADSLQVIVTPESITFDGARVLDFRQTAANLGSSEATYTFDEKDLDAKERYLRIIPLYEALLKAKEKSEVLRQKSKARDLEGKPLPFDGILAIQADKRVRYDTIRRIMYTAAAAGYKTFRFLAMRRET
ncbi:biopolymer transporter ExbD [Bdellovibrionota bacterium FG-1]